MFYILDFFYREKTSLVDSKKNSGSKNSMWSIHFFMQRPRRMSLHDDIFIAKHLSMFTDKFVIDYFSEGLLFMRMRLFSGLEEHFGLSPTFHGNDSILFFVFVPPQRRRSHFNDGQSIYNAPFLLPSFRSGIRSKYVPYFPFKWRALSCRMKCANLTRWLEADVCLSGVYAPDMKN